MLNVYHKYKNSPQFQEQPLKSQSLSRRREDFEPLFTQRVLYNQCTPQGPNVLDHSKREEKREAKIEQLGVYKGFRGTFLQEISSLKRQNLDLLNFNSENESKARKKKSRKDLEAQNEILF